MKRSGCFLALLWSCLLVACAADENGGREDSGRAGQASDGDGAAPDTGLLSDAARADAAAGPPRDSGGGDTASADGGSTEPPVEDAGPLPDGGDAGAACIDTDSDGHCLASDCDDQNQDVHPSRTEVCGNAFDDDCDGAVDEGCLEGTHGYFVDRQSLGGACADSHPGTLTQPWCTIAKANQTLTAGDTVYIRAGTYTDETIQPQASGLSQGQRITYGNYNDEEVILTGSVYCVRVQSRSYITILGLKFHDCERNLYLQDSSHVNVGYCEFDTPGGPTTWAGSRIYQGSQYNRIYHSSFTRYGSQSGTSPDFQDNGCILDIGNDNQEDNSDHNLIINNTFFYGGHHILGVYANNNVVRGNTFHNEEWYPCHRDDIGGLCGNRNLILNTSLPERNVRNLIEDNLIVFSGVPPDQVASAGLGIRTQYNIVRRNIFYHNDGAGLSLSTNSGNHNNPSNNFLYHNVFYHNGYTLLDDWDPRKTGMMLARWEDNSGYNDITGVAIKNNVFHDNQLYAIYYYYVEQQQQTVAGNWEEQGDPGFISISGSPDPFDFQAYDFHLRSDSPCVDNGSFLTRTADAGQNSTTLSVENAGYFSDGKGVAEPDMIQLEGQSAAVTITAIDYSANTITVDRPLSWPAGAGVSLPYLGPAPDQGVFEYGL